MNLEHLTLIVRDYEAAIRFFVNALGFDSSRIHLL